MPARTDGRVMVRCLGPGRREHEFLWNGDPSNRMCSRCRAEVDRIQCGVSPRMYSAVAAVDARDSRGRLRT